METAFGIKLETKFFSETNTDAVFEGYGSVYGNVDGGRDVIEHGAFGDSIATKTASGIKMLWQHDPAQPIGIFESLVEDDKGLRVKGKLLTSIPIIKEKWDMMKAGLVDGLSVGFQVLKHAWRDDNIRVIKQADLWEISVVTFPMNAKARVTAKKNDMTERDVEKILRDAGFSATEAKTIVASGFKTLKSARDAALNETSETAIATALSQLATLINPRTTPHEPPS